VRSSECVRGVVEAAYGKGSHKKATTIDALALCKAVTGMALGVREPFSQISDFKRAIFNSNGNLSLSNTLNKAQRIMRYWHWRRPLRARLLLDRLVDPAQRGGRVRRRCNGSPTRPQHGSKRRDEVVRRQLGRTARTNPRDLQPCGLLANAYIQRSRIASTACTTVASAVLLGRSAV
jgi:hypothetical protein